MAHQTRIISEEKGQYAALYKETSLNEMRLDREIRKLKSRLEQTSFTAADLTTFLKIGDIKSGHREDIKSVLSFGLDESISFQSRSRWISNASKFSEWMKSSDSKALFIEGHGEFERITPLSFFITLLHETLVKVPDTLVLTFFCGLNSKSYRDTGISGPTNMTKVLFAQLLALEGLDSGEEVDGDPPLSCLGVKVISRMCKNSHIAYMLALSQLLLKLGERYKAIFIMVDAVDFYDNDWKDEMLNFTAMVKELTRDFNKQRKKRGYIGALKTLVTASSRTTCFPSPGKSVAVIEIPEELDEEQDSYEQLELDT
jgi:hypothetical protein